jgi:hypothetical protein|tara:strand:- start:2635 stop:2850 length:216 start_codon:yes stop_codon:yes gene_type:complete
MQMTLDEFKDELARLNHRVMFFYEYNKPVKDQRKNAKNTRSYVNAQRGNFFGKNNKNANLKLIELRNLVKD